MTQREPDQADQGRALRLRVHGAPPEAGHTAATDPDWADSVVATTTTVARERAHALAITAHKLLVSDPERAELAIAQALAVAADMPDGNSKATAQCYIAMVLTIRDPDRARQLAGTITSARHRDALLAHIARAQAAADPDHGPR